MTVNKGEANAITRAVELHLAARVRRVRCGEYRVPSATRGGAVYTVRASGNLYECDCPAGEHGRPCKHKAAVLIAKVEHASRGRVTGPAATRLVRREPIRRAVATLRIDGLEYEGRGTTILDALAGAQPVRREQAAA